MTTGSAGARMPAGTKVLDRLVQEARLDHDQYQRVLLQAQRVDERCEDALIGLGYLSEGELLKYLAGIYRTRFVSTAKLRKAGIEPAALKLVPRKVCERFLVCPILYDRRTQTLSVVGGDLETTDVEKQVQVVSGVREVRAYVARPAAVEALIRKHYDQRSDAFDAIGARAPAAAGLEIDTGGGTAAYASPDYGTDVYGQTDLGSGLQGSGLQSSGFQDSGLHDSGLHDSGLHDTGFDAPGGSVVTSMPSPGFSGDPSPPPSPRPVAFTIEAPEIARDLASGVGETVDSVRFDDVLEMVSILVALLERERGKLRGHTAQVVRLARRVSERIGLSEGQMRSVLLAAQLHDVGKASAYHLTALNVARYDGHRTQAEKTYLTPVRMFESVNLPDETFRALAHLYERFDGKGFPDRLAGKDIPLGSRILAIVETYLDLTSHPKNPYRRELSPKEACLALSQHRSSVFDPNLVDLFERVVLGDDLQHKLLADRPRALVVDPDPEETTVLELRLIDHGFEVGIVRSAAEALERVREAGVDVIISEVDLPKMDGLEMVRRLRKDKQGAELPVVFLTRRSDRETVAQGFDVGADDFLVKPAAANVVAAKARQILSSRRPSRGVNGALAEMALPDVVQILANGRKSGCLRIEAGGKGGRIDFVEGAIWDAHFGELAAQEAFYAMLLLEEGQFSLESGEPPAERVIPESPESLLLEGMRRLDEGRR